MCMRAEWSGAERKGDIGDQFYIIRKVIITTCAVKCPFVRGKAGSRLRSNVRLTKRIGFCRKNMENLSVKVVDLKIAPRGTEKDE